MTEQDSGGTFRSGFACFVGRPNAGKSTLTNALVGRKVAITSDKPQTTRHTVRGIVHRSDGQLIIIDTPGLSKPRSLLQERLNDLVRATWTEVDVVAVALPSNQNIGPGDRYLVGQLAALRRPPTLVALATKTDLVSRERLARHLGQIAALQTELGIRFEEVLPCSALSGDQVSEVADVLLGLLPPGPDYYPDGEITDEPDEVLVAELIREAALEDVRDELPHSIAAQVEEMGLREGRPAERPLLDVFASLIVERDSQKGIMVGRAGERIKRIGSQARQQISAMLGTPVHLDLRVKVVKDWQRDAKQLNRLGL
ncbi:GTP-binding protein Era [Propionibacterium cyclohexanicum]|uniref:GTPase Era n=1 Tax=Propionibacterium cyclohexanicum TaxID=64702 RepID=A0A1H9Q7K5_9ACTN|nr:GTPase Era [Propionibacterium cyclohexanicum]SER56125.1 GTP-binding protein Era [Propionibacterium cyclohexanicum]